jgi:lysophospholipase L1-like esterase
MTLVVGALLIAGCASPATAPAAPNLARPTLTLAVMGASDAWGIGTRDPDRLNWPTFLAADLPGTAHLINLGVPGATLASSLRQQAPVVLGERPDALVIWLAVNDIIDGTPLTAYRADLSHLLSSVRTQSPHTLVFVGDVPDLTQLPYFSGWDQTALRAEVAAWNAAIMQVCGQYGATVVDLYSVWGQVAEHPEYISDDGLHPSTRGADALALVFASAIEQRLETAKR